jgi:sulfur-oxidizing protein SoxB
VFKPFVIKPINGVPVAIIGQAFPYTPIANPRYRSPGLELRHQGREPAGRCRCPRRQGAQVGRGAVAQRHGRRPQDGLRVRGVDAILGGHTHDGVPAPVIVKNGGGQTLVTNAGSNGKFLGVLDFDVKGGKVSDFRYKLLPVFANLIQPTCRHGFADREDARARTKRN